ncbi:MAG TPA: hypothetical protein DCZ94_05175 [Lentisphaeria bacterium]|nr:MAG: hypothetical protein A2X48_00080 [Lentisphaerae bacterium GWF2_49_21]HBC86330.1 hypothetical protein [Lentisphaeria bacterium]
MNKNLFYSLLVFYALMILCYSLNSGLTCTNDGSHFALVNSILERGSFELDDNLRFAKHDSAVFAGKHYSDRPPGLSFFLCMFNTAVSPVKGFLKMINFDDFAFLRTDYVEDLRITLFQLFPAFCCAALFAVIYFLLLKMSYKPNVSLIVALGFCCGTILLRYGTLLYSHIFTALLVTCSYSLAVLYSRNRSLTVLCLSTFLIAYAVITEYMSVLLLVPLFVFYAFKCRKEFFTIKHFSGFIISGMVPAVILMAYNYKNFGNPLSIAQFHHSTYVFYQDPGSIFFGTSFLSNAKVLLFYSPKYTTLFGGSIYLCSIFLLPFTLHALKRKPGAELLLFLSGFLITAAGVFSYTLCTGGLDLNYRHMLFGVPLLAPLVAETFSSVEALGERHGNDSAYRIYVIVFLGAVLYSFILQVRHVRTFFQSQRESLFCNLDAAFNNCSWFMVLLILYIFIIISFAVSVRRERSA